MTCDGKSACACNMMEKKEKVARDRPVLKLSLSSRGGMSASHASLAGDVAGSIIRCSALPPDFGARLGALMPGVAALR